MRYCPKCNARFDEEVIKFCTIDGTELIEEPNFIDSIDEEFGQETVVRTRSGVTPPDPRERIVVPTEQQYREQSVRQAQQRAYYPPPPPNTTKTVILTVFGTLAAVGLGAFLFWLFQGSPAANLNVNTNANFANQSVNLNTNLAFDSNFNFNSNANLNTNFNLPPLNLNLNLNTNASMRPSPTPKPAVSPTPRPSPAETETPDPTPNRTPAANRPAANGVSPAGTPRTGPRPPAGASNQPDGNRDR
jgi:hypothetical protein